MERTRASSRRRALPVLAAFVTVALLGVVSPSAAQAAVPDRPARTWGVGPADSTSSTIGAPRVLAILPLGDRIVVGGTFDSVIDPSGKEYPSRNIAVFSASTGAADLTFGGAANNSVTSLATDGAGTVYVGGTFGTVNGVARRGLAALDASTGNLLPWAPSVVSPGQVDALAYAGGAVYAGGNFAGLSDGVTVSRPYLAKIGATSGAVDPAWTPAPNDRVRALDVASDGTARLFVGGDFTSVQAGSSTSRLAAVFLGGPGQADLMFRAGPTNGNSYATVYDLISDGSRLYAAAGGSGGACAALSSSSGSAIWSDRTNGNVQSVRLYRGLLYCGGHFNGDASFAGQTRYKLAAVDPATGSPTAFAPVVNSAQGVWALGFDATHLYLGGDFSAISGIAQPHFAMLLDTGAQTPPRAPTNWAATAASGVVHLSWGPPSSDGGTALLKYRVYRALSPGAEDLTKAPLATLGKTDLAYDDTGVTNGIAYYYVILATNAIGASPPSNEVVATPQVPPTLTVPGPPTGLTATSLPGLIRLNWIAPGSSGGSDVSSYRVYRGTGPGMEDMRTPVATLTATSLDDSAALTVGSSYYYVVTATNQLGEGSPSNEASTVAQAGVPGGPVLSGVMTQGPCAVLQWTVPPDGGGPITKYVVVRDSVRLVTLAASASGPTTYSDATIAPGSTAVYQVRAVNAVGSGPPSNKVTLTAP
jgi:hypothetical protein